MAGNQLPISVVVNVSVAAPQQGAGEYNTSNLAIFSRDSYAASFGTAAYKIYLNASAVGIDFGTTSNTYQMALAMFAQQPNILSGGGYLVVIPFLSAAQDQQVLISFNGQPASGDFYIEYNGNFTAAIAYNALAATIQSDLQSVSGLSSATCTGSISPSVGLTINSEVSGVGHPFLVANQYVFTVSSANATQGATYTSANGVVFTVQATISGQTTLTTSTPSGGLLPAASGTLTKASGTGDSTITYSAWSTLSDSNSNPISMSVTVLVPGSTNETLDQAILRTQDQVQYFGVMATEIPPSQTVLFAAAALIQTLNKIAFFTSYTVADIEPGGMLANLALGGYTQSRAEPYFETNSSNQPLTSLEYMAAYAGLGLSTSFNGSNTTQTMNLKGLSTILPDPGLTATIYTYAQSGGGDVYANIQGIAKVLTSGANDFFDNQYNLQWFAGAVQVAYFNALATTNTKVPQTEQGMDVIKGAIQAVCQQAVANGFVAPGVWNNPTVFGNPATLIANIAQYGYYIYSSPIAAQLQSVRVQRVAPIIQIAIKYAGALQSGQAIVYVNP
jgi:Protein of unknown function (DUF3383)